MIIDAFNDFLLPFKLKYTLVIRCLVQAVIYPSQLLLEPLLSHIRIVEYDHLYTLKPRDLLRPRALSNLRPLL